jgi:hypothetical protein
LDWGRSGVRSLLRFTVIIGVATASLAVSVWGVSTLMGARSDLRANSPMQSEKRVALAGPFGALANRAEDPDAPQVAGLLFEPHALGADRARGFDRTVQQAANSAPMVIEHPHVAIAPPLPPERPAAAPQLASIDPPLPPQRPAPAPKLASIEPPPAVEAPRSERARNGAFTLPDIDKRTAVYDIAARTVYLPNGRKLEAHSGLGEKMDDPRYVNVKMRGATPPNVYALSLREQLFHGVRAIRLTPLDEGKMFGRGGILAHTYMLGPSGQSNGCVSFENYQAFLQAYLRGEVERMVVVSHLPKSSAPALMSMRQDNDHYY